MNEEQSWVEESPKNRNAYIAENSKEFGTFVKRLISILTPTDNEPNLIQLQLRKNKE